MTPDRRETKARVLSALPRAGRPALMRRLSDEARFVRSWLDRPLVTGAISPSGPALSRAMAEAVDPGLPGPVIELGPGTGPVTEALLARGVPEHRLILVEYDAAFCALLSRRFPSATVVQGNAYDLERTLAGWLPERAAAIVSSLPLLTRPEQDRAVLLREAFRLLQPRAPFVQFTYGVASPVPLDDGGIASTVSAPIWLNLPPARVWVYRRDASVAARPKGDVIDRWIGQADHACDEILVRLRVEMQGARDKVQDRIRLQRRSLGRDLRRLGEQLDPPAS